MECGDPSASHSLSSSLYAREPEVCAIVSVSANSAVRAAVCMVDLQLSENLKKRKFGSLA